MQSSKSSNYFYSHIVCMCDCLSHHLPSVNPSVISLITHFLFLMSHLGRSPPYAFIHLTCRRQHIVHRTSYIKHLNCLSDTYLTINDILALFGPKVCLFHFYSLSLTSSKILSLKKTQNSFGFFLTYSYLCSIAC